MTFKSKRTITSMATGAAMMAAYIIYAMSARAPSAGELAAWARLLLVFIGAAIAVVIGIQVLFHILFAVGVAVRERERTDGEVERIVAAEVHEDELDKLVTLKASHVGYTITGCGLVAALVLLAFFGVSAIAALHVFVGAAAVGAFIEGGVSIRLYEKGVV